MREFARDRILRRLPTLTPAEKTALASLVIVLAIGTALRTWERSGVTLGPVDDWESLRALLIGARADHAAQGGGKYACLEDPTGSGHGGGGGVDGTAGRPLLTAGAGAGRAGGKGKTGSSSTAGKKAPPPRPVDLNTAGEKTLLTLPGVGPSTAKAIIARRAERGKFRAVEELLEVKGIGPKKFEALRPFVRIAGPPGGDSVRSPPGGHTVKTAPDPATPGGDL